MVVDNISNLIISLKNASKAGKDCILAPFTKINVAILNVLKANNFVADFEAKEKNRQIKVVLKYNDDGPAITDVKRISKNSKRIYQSVKDIKKVRNGFGIGVLSTPNGVLSTVDARAQKVGGEILFEIW